MSRYLRTCLQLCLVAILSSALAVEARADRTQEARSFIDTTVGEFLEILREESLSSAQQLAKIEDLAIQRFDLDRMSKLVLGRNRKKLDDTQQTEFRDEFKEHISITYGRSIEDYSDERVEIVDAREEKNGDVTVKTKIVGGSVDGILVDYRLRSKDGAPWRVIDVIIEGVSMIQNFRSQIQEIVSSKGADKLIVILREKNERDAKAATQDGTE